MRSARCCMRLSRAFTSLRFPRWPSRGGKSSVARLGLREVGGTDWTTSLDR